MEVNKTNSSYKEFSIYKNKEIFKEPSNNNFESSATYDFTSNFKLNDDQITFINYTHKYCIAIIDIVNSTKITEKLPNSEQIRKYYSIFLNTMASIIKQHNGKVIKNAGDCLIYYFPKTVGIINSSSNYNNNINNTTDNSNINSRTFDIKDTDIKDKAQNNNKIDKTYDNKILPPSSFTYATNLTKDDDASTTSTT